MFWHLWENVPVSGNKSQKISTCTCPFANTRQQKPLKIILCFCNIFSVMFSSNNEECHQLKSSGCRVLPVSGSVYAEVSLVPKAIHAQQHLPEGVTKAAWPHEHTRSHWPYKASTCEETSTHLHVWMPSSRQGSSFCSHTCCLAWQAPTNGYLCPRGDCRSMWWLGGTSPSSPWECRAVPRRTLPCGALWGWLFS